AFFDVSIGDRPAGQLVFELRRDVVGKTCENFMKLCTGEVGISKSSGYELHYKNSKFHRIVPNQVCQGGDFTRQDGTGGESIFGPDGFDDESFSLKHTGPGVLSMVNAGPNTNGSQFFISLARLPELDNTHVVFGYLVEGAQVLHEIERCGTPSGKPSKDVVISHCGTIEF
ncbi:Peptidyl-prolyl cis-trans isomerase CYP19-2 (PPIase CYP19-2) (Cyclophilin of 19 kDa 2) (Cyclophilin-2) (Rotamase cyclophilin-6), partial [Durusdinium trenchii]